MSPSQYFVNILLGLSATLSGVFALLLVVTVILSISARDDYDRALDGKAPSVENRRSKFTVLRRTRQWRTRVLIALSASLLTLAITDSIVMQQRLLSAPISDPSLLGQIDTYESGVSIPMDPYGTLAGVQMDLSDYNAGLPWLIFAWMAFAIAAVLLIVQLWAKPWETYDQTGDEDFDELYASKMKLLSDFETLTKQRDKLLKRQSKADEEHFNTLRDYTRVLDDRDAVVEENLSLVETLTSVEHERSRLEGEVDRLTPEEE